jgi:hypothetical protein
MESVGLWMRYVNAFGWSDDKSHGLVTSPDGLGIRPNCLVSNPDGLVTNLAEQPIKNNLS